MDQGNAASLSNIAYTAQHKLLDEGAKGLDPLINANNSDIEAIKARIAALPTNNNVAQNLQHKYITAAGIEGPYAEPPVAELDANFWTHISTKSSSDFQSSQSSSSSTSYGASPRWGWFASGGGSHSEAHSDASQEMAKSSINVEFDCMVSLTLLLHVRSISF